ncbi:LysR family transcriptional regulator [Ancylobacter lacus]|uniref:LysR family transcriptional regulator n=1 Tax=Ancylobacter lacus TaxID=2579970 RepID=UPI001BD153C8|nr:LysR family transcriptional regulator [Ancylobacter lacus]MBS7538876.1 LysR family transcriptional regulator [Ancylobacter lacus]
MDTLLSLRVFAAVAEARSFVAVAERLGLSAAMTSKHVQHLEARLGARLLNRSSRKVSLTEAGAIYLDRVRPLLEGLDEAGARISQTALAPHGSLKVSLPVWMANPAFARMLATYRQRCPEVTLDIDLSGEHVNLVEDGYDLALRVSLALQEGLVARRLAEIAFYMVAAPALLDRIGRPASLRDLNGAPFLAYTPVTTTGRLRLGSGPGATEIRLRPVLRSANEALLHLAAIEGMGLLIIPQPVVQRDLDTGVLERLLPDQPAITAPLSAIYPDRSFLPAKTRSFLDFLAGPDGFGGGCVEDRRPADRSPAGRRP